MSLDIEPTRAGGATPKLQPEETGRRAKSAWLLLFVIGVVWGSTFSLAKLSTQSGAHPLGVAWWQAAIGSGLVLAYLALRRTSPPVSKQHIIFYAVCGALGTAVPSTFFFYAAPHVPAGIISITVATVPILTFAVAVSIKLEQLDIARLTGIILGIIAVAMIVAPETSLPDPGMALWVLLCIAASVCYALENLWISLRQPPGSSAFVILAGMLVMAAAMLTPAVLVTGTFVSLIKPWGITEFSIVAMAIVSTFAYGLFIQVITLAGPVFASQAAYLITVSGILWGMAIFGEQHSLRVWSALIVMMAGLALVKPRT